MTYTVPLLDDASVFKWHEQNPGLADYYELRIYAKDGKTLLATQKITGKQSASRWEEAQCCTDLLPSRSGIS